MIVLVEDVCLFYVGLHTRQQLLVFGTANDTDVAEFWAESMLRELGRHQTVTSIDRRKPTRLVAEVARKAYIRPPSVAHSRRQNHAWAARVPRDDV